MLAISRLAMTGVSVAALTSACGASTTTTVTHQAAAQTVTETVTSTVTVTQRPKPSPPKTGVITLRGGTTPKTFGPSRSSPGGYTASPPLHPAGRQRWIPMDAVHQLHRQREQQARRLVRRAL